MLRRSWLDTLALAVAGALALLLGTLALRPAPPPPTPRSLTQIARMADDLGLHHRSDVEDGRLNVRLMVSVFPMSFVRANGGHVGQPDHPCWRGTLAAYASGRLYTYLCDGRHGVLWGDIFLYGDPELIHEIMAAPVPVEADA